MENRKVQLNNLGDLILNLAPVRLGSRTGGSAGSNHGVWKTDIEKLLSPNQKRGGGGAGICGVRRCPLKKNTEEDEQNEREEVVVRSPVAAAKSIIVDATREPELGRASTLNK